MPPFYYVYPMHMDARLSGADRRTFKERIVSESGALKRRRPRPDIRIQQGLRRITFGGRLMLPSEDCYQPAMFSAPLDSKILRASSRSFSSSECNDTIAPPCRRESSYDFA